MRVTLTGRNLKPPLKSRITASRLNINAHSPPVSRAAVFSFFPFAIGFTLYISKEEDVRTPSPGMVWFLEAVSKSAVPLNRGPFPYRPHGNGIKECWTGKALFPLWLVLHSSGEKAQAPNNNIAVRLAFTGAPLSASHSIVLLKVTQEGGC